jgi:hypothetical protein
MSELRRRRFVDVVFIDALFTIAAGSFLYWHDWHTYPSFGDWIGSNFGAALTVGALLAISAIIIAGVVTRPTIDRLVSLGKQAEGDGSRACVQALWDELVCPQGLGLHSADVGL